MWSGAVGKHGVILRSHFACAFPPVIIPCLHLQRDGILSRKFKMKSVTILLLVTCVVASCYGDLVCGTNYCSQNQNQCAVPVAKTSCRSPSVYRERHAGKCACCPACVTLLAEGAACKHYSKELGETPSAICRDPLLCQRGVCTKVTRRT